MTLLLIDYYYKAILVSIFIEIFFLLFCCCCCVLLRIILHHLYFITAHNLILICFNFHINIFLFSICFHQHFDTYFSNLGNDESRTRAGAGICKGGKGRQYADRFLQYIFFIIISLLVVVVYVFSQTLLLPKVLGGGHKNQHPLFIIVVLRFWDLFYDCCQKCFIGALVLHDFIFILFSTFFLHPYKRKTPQYTKCSRYLHSRNSLNSI